MLTSLHERCERLVVLGTSRGAEAAPLLGARHPEIDAVVAISAPHIVWAALSTDRPQRSSWTRGGDPLSFVPYDDGWEPETDDMVEEVVARRSAAELHTELVSHPRAGHRVVLPGEQPSPRSHLVHGGTPAADAELGELVWPHLVELLGPA